MANRLPAAGHRHRACLVSLEQRTDLVPSIPWRTGDAVPAAPATARLVLLHTWTFTAAPARPGGGSFRELAVGLDSGLIGTGDAGRHRHRPRAGQRCTTGPAASSTRGTAGHCCPRPVARDALGPYHSADQARRVSPETGLEDISYSAAFELGRLLAAADPRLGQELMRWRREAYRQAARSSVATTVWSSVPKMVVRCLRRSATGDGRAGGGHGARACRRGRGRVGRRPGARDREQGAGDGPATARERLGDDDRAGDQPAARDAASRRPTDHTQPDVFAARERMAATEARHEGAPE